MRRRRAEAQVACTRESKLVAALVKIERVREILRQMRWMQPLSASAQQRLDAAIRQQKQNLDAEFSQRVVEEVARRMRTNNS